ncbi:glycosyltransferase family 4 protein [Candidatus Parcubacteria bacterium]|nr:glycosyltransferase family 4 protein [Candidatus Parcubacteria bacterium]
MPQRLREADIFVRPSLSEGQGISFIEAMAAGLPVVATPVGGITDFLKDGGTGLFAKPGDPASIAEAVKRLIGDSALREKVRKNALELVREKYDWSLIAGEMRSKVFATT